MLTTDSSPKRRSLYIILFITTSLAFIIAGCSGKPDGLRGYFEDDREFSAAMDCYDRFILDSAELHFANLTSKYPTDPYAWAWRAKASSYLGDRDTTLAYAKRALALDPRNAFALEIYAHCYNPQYLGVKGANYETVWEYLQKAVRSDPSNGDAWIGLQLEAMRRGDRVIERKALARLLQTEFFSSSSIELNRWMLKYLPPRAILITAGDLDTFGAEALQTIRNERPDIAIVNCGMLLLPWYVREVLQRYDLPLPLSRDSLDFYDDNINTFSRITGISTELLDPERAKQELKNESSTDRVRNSIMGQDSSDADFNRKNLFLLHTAIIRWWRLMQGTSMMNRPIVFSASCDSDIVRIGQPAVNCGGYFRCGSSSEVSTDWDAFRRAFFSANGKSFAGKPYSVLDRSAYRRHLPDDYAAAFPYSVGVAYLKHLISIKADKRTTSETRSVQKEIDDLIVKLERFALEAHVSEATIKQCANNY